MKYIFIQLIVFGVIAANAQDSTRFNQKYKRAF